MDQDYPYLWFQFHDKIKLNQKVFYNVFTPGSNKFYYSQDKGIIAFKKDTTIWINEKYN